MVIIYCSTYKIYIIVADRKQEINFYSLVNKKGCQDEHSYIILLYKGSFENVGL